MLKSKDVPRLMNVKYWKRVHFMTPSIYFLKAEHIFRFLFDNGIGFMTLMELFWMLSIGIFYDLVIGNKIRHLVHLLRVVKAMQHSVREFVDEAFDESPLVHLTTVSFLVTELSRRNLSLHGQREFFNWCIENNVRVFDGTKIALDRDDFDVLFTRWISSKQKSKTYQDLENQ